MSELEIARAIEDAIRQRIADINVSFPVIIEEYLGPVHKPGGGMELGVLQARARVRPKYTKMLLNGEEVELPPLLTVPVSWWLVGDFLFSFPFKRGQIAKVTCSQRALDYILKTHEPEHPRIVEFHREDDAILEPFGIRVESDPLRPDEALDSLYIACVKNQPYDLTPIAKFMMKPDGEIKFVCPKFTVISPDIELGAYNKLEAIRINVDKDNDSETNGPDIHPSGSKCTFIATTSTYREGITEPRWTKGEVSGQAESPPASSTLGGWLDNLGKTASEAVSALGFESVSQALAALGLPSSLGDILDQAGWPSLEEIPNLTLGKFSQATGVPVKELAAAAGYTKLSDLLSDLGVSSVSELLDTKKVQDVLAQKGIDLGAVLRKFGLSPEGELRKATLGDLAKVLGKTVDDVMAGLRGG